MSATITIKATPREFDLIRQAINEAIEMEEARQQNIKDEQMGTSAMGNEATAVTKEIIASNAKIAEYALLLERLQ